MTARPRILLLGGTAEALLIAHALSGPFDVIYSLAGATAKPRLPKTAQVRVGGFGGVGGLQRYCQDASIDLIVDATHPFAATMSRAAIQAGLPVLRLERPKWTRMRGDRWTSVPHAHAALSRLRHLPGPFALALGRGGQKMAQTLGTRAILRRWDPALALALDDPMAEAEWLTSTRANLLVCKNAGGKAFGKLVAARRLGMPVMMIERPKVLGGEVFDDVGWLVRTIQFRHG